MKIYTEQIQTPKFVPTIIKGETLLDVFLQMEDNQEMKGIQKRINEVKSQLEAILQIDRARIFLDLNNEFYKNN